MNLFFILLLLALIAGGYYVYQRLLAIEREIRAEQRALAAEQDAAESEVASETPVARSEPVVTIAATEESLETQVLRMVDESPGITQTDLYARFADGERRELQKLLRQLDEQGRLRREKKGNSYRLHPLG